MGPNIRFRILFSNTLNLYSSLNVRDHASEPYSRTGNIIVLSPIKVIHISLCKRFKVKKTDYEFETIGPIYLLAIQYLVFKFSHTWKTIVLGNVNLEVRSGQA